MHIVILSRNRALYNTNRLEISARERGHEVSVINPLSLQLVVRSGCPELLVQGQSLPHVDLVIPRIGSGINNYCTYSLAVVRQFELLGVHSLNSALAISRCHDKLRALQMLTRNGLAVPTTVCARSPEAMQESLKIVGGCPAIVKLRQGSRGIGTMIAETPQAVTSLLETLWAMGQDIQLQQYIRESKGRDVRAIVVGHKVIAGMRRTAKAGEFRSNLHRGGLGVGIELKPAYRAAAIAASRVMGLEVAGVDMVETRSGPKILEVNSSPGLEGVERATGLDIAKTIIKFAERRIKRKTTSDAEGDALSDNRRIRLRGA